MRTRPLSLYRVAPWFLSGWLPLAGCATVQHARAQNGYCSPPLALPGTWNEDPVDEATPRLKRVAALLGVAALAEGRNTQSDAAAARLRALERLEAARTIVSATTAELDCEGERTSQLASYLEGLDERSTLLYTASSIVVGAATGLVSAFLDGAGRSVALQQTVAVSGGVATAALGLVPLYRRSRAQFTHPRNLLAEIWLGPVEPTIFPDLVWAYLARREFSNDGSAPIRVKIVERWKGHEMVQGDPAETLLFGAGGVYDAAQLRQRADMLDQVKAEVDLMNQDLAALATMLTRAGG